MHAFHRRHRGRLSIADMLILVAATALGLLVVRFAMSLGLYDESMTRKAPPGRLLIERLSVYGAPLLAIWTVATLMLGLIRSRPPRRRLRRSPGFVACVSASAAIVYCLMYYAVKARSTAGEPGSLISQHYANLTIQTTHYAGLLVIGAWLSTAMAGRRRPGATWTDRLGCLLGVCWVGVFLADQGYWLVTMLNSR